MACGEGGANGGWVEGARVAALTVATMPNDLGTRLSFPLRYVLLSLPINETLGRRPSVMKRFRNSAR